MKKIIILFGILLFSTTFVFSQSTSLSIGTVQAKVGESVSVPINVLNLSDAGAISLKINYDSAKLSFIGVENSAVTFTANANAGVITLGWFDATAANPLTISSGKLVDLKFSVTGGSGTTSNISFIQSACEIANSAATPVSVSYNGGGVEINVPAAAKLTIASATAAAGSNISLPIKVMEFKSIAAISLKINYNPSVLNFNGLSNAPAGVVYTSNAANGVITIGWFDATGGNSALTLTDNSTLVNLDFSYLGSNTNSVVGFNSSASELSNASGVALTNVTYVNGGVAPLAGTVPTLKIGDVQSAPNKNILVPIDARKISNVGAISLKIKYNAALLTFTGVSNTVNGITLTNSATTGVLTLGWFDANGNSPINLDSVKLADLNFTIAAGSGTLEFLTSQSEISNSLGQIIGVSYGNGSVQTVAVPSAPVLLSPATGVLNQPVSLTLAWNASANADSYKLQVSSSATFSTLIVNDSTISTTSKQVSGLLNNTKYYWRVSAKNAAGNSAFSNVFDFTTIVAAVVAPKLLTPANNAVNQPVSLTLSWEAVTNAASYRLQVATNSTFTDLVVNDSLITSTSKAVSSLLNNKKYYWRVNAKNAAGTSVYSDTYNFTTIIAIPNAPVLIAPVNNKDSLRIEVNYPIEFVWYRSSGATTYHLQISTNSQFTALVAQDSLLTDSTYSFQSWKKDVKYFWRVYAKNSAGKSVASPVWNFTVKIVTDVDNSDNTVPEEYSLMQNYPNPFNPSTTIKYNLPVEGFVSIKVYDILGNEVSTLVNNNLPAGRYSVDFNASNLPSGVYIYRIQSNSFTAVKKLMLLK